MAQIGIVFIDGNYYREYQFAQGERLDKVCLDFGEKEWGRVWSLDVNLAFRALFLNQSANANDPVFVVQGGPAILRIPLIGGVGAGSKKLARLRDYILVRIVNVEGLPFGGIEVFRLDPRASPPGVRTNATADGDVAVINLKAGDYRLVSTGFEFTAQNNLGSGPVPATTPMAGYLLRRNTIDTIVARRAFHITCPMCDVTFRTVSKPIGTNNLCPNDGFNLTQIERQILQEEELALAGSSYQNRYLVPVRDQNPSDTPIGLTSRGTSTLQSAYGQVTVYWDESRFFDPVGPDYTLWGKPTSGPPITARIIGRATWGAQPPIVGRSTGPYEFQEAARGASLAFTNISIPKGENLPLKSVFQFITIHHTQDPPLNSFNTVRGVQNKHQTAPRLWADVGYHYIIDGNGDIYEGRPLGIEGHHSPLFNGGNIGIVVAGEYQVTASLPPPDVRRIQRDTLFRLVDVLSLRFGEKEIGGHRQREITVLPTLLADRSLLDDARTEPPPTLCPGIILRPVVDELVRKYRGSTFWEPPNPNP